MDISPENKEKIDVIIEMLNSYHGLIIDCIQKGVTPQDAIHAYRIYVAKAFHAKTNTILPFVHEYLMNDQKEKP